MVVRTHFGSSERAGAVAEQLLGNAETSTAARGNEAQQAQ